MKPICIDANVFIASTKGNETYSSDCRRVIEAVGNGEFYLIEPTICLVSIWEICDDHFCTSAGYTGALYGIYSLDSIYLETALRHNAVFVTLDDLDFLSRIKERVGIEVYHPKDFP